VFRKVKNQLLAAAVVVTVYAPVVFGAESPIKQGANSSRPGQKAPDGTFVEGTTTPGSLVDSFRDITNTVLFLVGAVAVIALIYGGFRYVASGGNAKDVETAKSTIIYAVIGIVVAILAYAIVNFVTGALTP